MEARRWSCLKCRHSPTLSQGQCPSQSFFESSANSLPAVWSWTWAISGRCFDIPERIELCRSHDLSMNFSTSSLWIVLLRFTWPVWPFMHHTEPSHLG